MANGQSMCRPTTSWLSDTQSKHDTQQQQQQYQRDKWEPVRVMTNGTCDPSERSDGYMRRFGEFQPEPESPAHLNFLYDRAQKPVQSPTACPYGLVGMTSPLPHADEYRSLSRAVPAPVQQQQQSSPAAKASSSPEYTPFSRAMPAPIQQHAAASAGPQRPTAGTPTSPRTTQLTQHQNSQPHDAQVYYVTWKISLCF